MPVAAEIALAHEIGAGMKGPFIRLRAATVTTVAQTVQLAPFKLSDPTNAYVLRDAGPNDTAGALTVVSLASDGKSITFTPASTGFVGLILCGTIDEQ